MQEVDDRATVLTFWDIRAGAVHGGNTIGPTLFHEHGAPYLASDQQRTLGDVIVDILQSCVAATGLAQRHAGSVHLPHTIIKWSFVKAVR